MPDRGNPGQRLGSRSARCRPYDGERDGHTISETSRKWSNDNGTTYRCRGSDGECCTRCSWRTADRIRHRKLRSIRVGGRHGGADREAGGSTLVVDAERQRQRIVDRHVIRDAGLASDEQCAADFDAACSARASLYEVDLAAHRSGATAANAAGTDCEIDERPWSSTAVIGDGIFCIYDKIKIAVQRVFPLWRVGADGAIVVGECCIGGRDRGRRAVGNRVCAKTRVELQTDGRCRNRAARLSDECNRKWDANFIANLSRQAASVVSRFGLGGGSPILGKHLNACWWHIHRIRAIRHAHWQRRIATARDSIRLRRMRSRLSGHRQFRYRWVRSSRRHAKRHHLRTEKADQRKKAEKPHE